MKYAGWKGVKLEGDDYEALYRRHAPGAFRRAQRLLGSQSDADEVVHDVFVRLLEQPASFRGRSRITTYLYSAVTHACLNRIRNQRTRQRLAKERHLFEQGSDPGTRADWLIAARDLLQSLPDPLPEVAVYYYVDELSQRDIGRIIGCSHRQVGLLLRRLEGLVADQQAQEEASCP